jgi:hypothetical protein
LGKNVSEKSYFIPLFVSIYRILITFFRILHDFSSIIKLAFLKVPQHENYTFKIPERGRGNADDLTLEGDCPPLRHLGGQLLQEHGRLVALRHCQRRIIVEGLYCQRPIQCLESSEILTPHPLTFATWRGGGGSIVQ